MSCLNTNHASSEAYQLAMYLLNQYRGTVLSCRYAIPLRFVPAESRSQLHEAVKVALVETIMRHPMLQVGMIDATSKTPSWIQLQSLDLTQHIKWLYLNDQEADFEQKVQETFRVQLDELFPDLSARQPSWKITLIRQRDAPIMEALLTWNHPWFDGAGAKVIHEDMLGMLNADNGSHERPGLHGDVLTLPRTTPLLPIPLEKLQCLPVSLSVLAKAFWEDIRPQVLNRDVSYAAWCPIKSSPYKTQFRSFFIDDPSLLALLALCRQNKTTITGLLNGLALIAFSLHLDEKSAPAFQSSTIVDHRRNLPPAPSDAPWGSSDRVVANYVTQCLHRWDQQIVTQIRSKLTTTSDIKHLSPELQRELWAISAQNRQDIVDKLRTGLQNDLIGIFKYVTDWQKTMSDMASKKRQFTWLITNIGVLNGNNSTASNPPPSATTTTAAKTVDNGGKGEGKGWSITRAQFGLSTEIPAAAFEFAPVSVAGGGMCVSVNWPDCAVDAALGERIMVDLERWLAQLAKQS